VLLPVNHAPESRGGPAPVPRYREHATELWHTSHKEKDMAGERPVGVTIVAVIAWIIGAIQIVGGILAIIAGGGFPAWIVLIVGIITIAVSLGLFRGNNTARIIMAVVFVINLLLAIWAIIMGVDFWDQVVAGLLAVVGLVFLYSRKASAFFS
jgi:hypothetical protein